MFDIQNWHFDLLRIHIFYICTQVTTSRDETDNADKNEQEFVDSINNLSKVKWLVEKEEELIDKLKKELVQSALSKNRGN